MKPLALIVGLLLLARADAAEELSNDMSATEGVEKTALLSFPERFCELTELSEPRAHIVFALQIKGKITYFKTKTRCSDFPGRKLEHPIFGEKVRLFGGNRPTAIRRETGAFYQVDPTDPIRMYFDPGATHNLYEAPRYEEHRQHEQVMMECLLLIDTKEGSVSLVPGGPRKGYDHLRPDVRLEAREMQAMAGQYNRRRGKRITGSFGAFGRTLEKNKAASRQPCSFSNGPLFTPPERGACRPAS